MISNIIDMLSVEAFRFNSSFAKKYGVNEAVILSHISSLLDYNKGIHENFYDGKYWICCSMSALAENIPFFTISQVRRYIENLCKKGVLLKGNYSESKLDKRCWYTIDNDVLYRDDQVSYNKKLSLPEFCNVPLNARNDDKLSAGTSIYYGELISLANDLGVIYATDLQLAEMKNVDTSTIERWHKELENSGYITREKGKITVHNQ
jgi:predicted transcriptional regulator